MELNSTQIPEEDASPAKVWGYGFLFVTIINLSALGGVWVIPLMNKTIYKQVLMYLVSLAVGTLCGNAILSLIPEAHGMILETHGSLFIWKNLTVLGGIYLFFNTERVLKIIGSRRREKARKNKQDFKPQSSVQVTAMHNLDSNPDRIGYKFTSPTEAMAMSDAIEHTFDPDHRHDDSLSGMVHHTSGRGTPDRDEEISSTTDVFVTNVEANHRSNGLSNGVQNNHHGHSHHPTDLYHSSNMIATVAYMIIFGDGLHNFIDGLAIGASFSNSLYQGISTSIAVICEEFPHELGDFAILLNSGMSVKQAVLANLLSACTCYLGLIMGILLGENTHASEWIFALAGGMFLYISLVDMLPEINNVGGGDPNHEDQRSIKIFFIQNAGLLTGFGVMLILAFYAGQIEI